MGKTALVLCSHFRREMEALQLPEKYNDLEIVYYRGHCGLSPLNWDQLKVDLLAGVSYDSLNVFYGGCINGLPEELRIRDDHHPAGNPQCFNLIINPDLVTTFQQKGYHLLTPGWLEHWPEMIKAWGFDQSTAREFFKESAQSLLLLNTGVDSQAKENLQAFSAYLELGAEEIAVGLDYLALIINNRVLKDLLQDQEKQKLGQKESLKELADLAMALDLLSSLARIKSEEQVIASIKEMFMMLFAPREVKLTSGRESESDLTADERLIGEDSFAIAIRGSEGALAEIEVLGLHLPHCRLQYLQLASKIANVCGLALENAHHYQQIKTISDTDGLTGIANRRKLEDQLEKAWLYTQRHGNELTLAMIDIDYFKNFNDLYGHLAGDRCLQAVATVIDQYCRRPGDLAARYGGEEFTLVLPDTSLEGALVLAEKIRKAIEDLQIVHNGSTASAYITVSIGLASMVPAVAGGITELLQLADQALFKAKDSGRNQVISL